MRCIPINVTITRQPLQLSSLRVVGLFLILIVAIACAHVSAFPHLATEYEHDSSNSNGGADDKCGRDAPLTCGTTRLTYKSPPLTTNFGSLIHDDENSLKANPRGPTLMEDNILREKITHFDHERIPERVVHARGSTAHGYFENYKSLSHITKADMFQRAGEKTHTFVRFSTVTGGAGSVDLPRDVRGFATRFYTKEGNWDLVGNDIPVFFVQDAMKFPDLVHSAKMEPDRGFPQAATAHHNFWDFVSLMPESMHTVLWAMSDRGIPRSYRNIEGFGVNTFTMLNSTGGEVFIKFHWKPIAGLQSVLWDEAVKINGADPDFHRRDLWEAVENCNTTGVCPQYELGIQVIPHELASILEEAGMDVLDATKLIPEEIVPVTPIGKMTLNRNQDNFFMENEQLALHPGNLPPGIDISDDPLLQGRLFSYIDTQITRLGGPNFHEIPINQPECPMRNFQRDGFKRSHNDPGRINYSPNSGGVPNAKDTRNSLIGRVRYQSGNTIRARSSTFADHYSQPRLFYLSQTSTEKTHIISALITEWSLLDGNADEIRRRLLGHIRVIDEDMATRVSVGLGIDISTIKAAVPLVAPHNFTEDQLSPKLSIIMSATNDTLQGRKVAIVIGEGSDTSLLSKIKKAIVAAGAVPEVLARTLAPISGVVPDGLYSARPSPGFDSIVVLLTQATQRVLSKDTAMVSFVADAWAHLKVIGHAGHTDLLTKAGVENMEADGGIIDVSARSGVDNFITAAKNIKVWAREPKVHILP